MKRINWTVRIKNPVFWAQVAVAIVIPILAALGMDWSEVTSWGKLGSIFLQAISNPTIVVAVLISMWNTINDPTTTGLADSKIALTYKKPRNSEKEPLKDELEEEKRVA